MDWSIIGALCLGIVIGAAGVIAAFRFLSREVEREEKEGEDD